MIVLVLLLVNGISAHYGGWNLMTHPDGASLNLPISYLAHSPFRTFLVPGIILFFINGVLSFLILSMVLFNIRQSPLFVILQGILLIGWILIQMLLIQEVVFLQFFMCTIAIVLIIAGWFLYHTDHGGNFHQHG